MKIKKCIILFICNCMILGACRDNDVDNIAEYNQQTIMIYMVGSDLESQEALATVDIEEMLASDFDEDKLNVLLCTGGASFWWTEGIPTDKCMVYEVSPNQEKLIPIQELNGNNMSEPELLTEFMDYGYSEYPSDSYSLIMWNHGGGAILGYGADENNDYSSLSVADLNSALDKTLIHKDNKKLEYIGFDACLMGMLEVAASLTDNCNYMISSEERMAGTGWDYSILRNLSEQKEADGINAATEIINAYEASIKEKMQYTQDYTMSCLDMSKVKDVTDCLNEFVPKLNNELQSGGYSKLARIRSEVKSFGKVTAYGYYDIIDLYDWAFKMQELFPNEADSLMSAVDNLVIYHKTNISDSNGIAFYFPYENTDNAQEWIEIYNNTGFSDVYVNFVEDFAGILCGEPIGEWIVEDLEPQQTEKEGQYYVKLPDELLENYSCAQYSVWQQDSMGSYVFWFNSSDANLSEKGVLTGEFNGKLMYLKDEGGSSIPVCAIEIERTQEYSKYAVPIVIYPEEMNLESRTAYIHVKLNNESELCEVIGIYNTPDMKSSIFPDRNVVAIEDKCYIYPYYFAREIVFLEDGSIAPFDSWESTSGIGDGFQVSGSLSVEMKIPEEKEEYCYLFLVEDTQGNSSFTNSSDMVKNIEGGIADNNETASFLNDDSSYFVIIDGKKFMAGDLIGDLSEVGYYMKSTEAEKALESDTYAIGVGYMMNSDNENIFNVTPYNNGASTVRLSETVIGGFNLDYVWAKNDERSSGFEVYGGIKLGSAMDEVKAVFGEPASVTEVTVLDKVSVYYEYESDETYRSYKFCFEEGIVTSISWQNMILGRENVYNIKYKNMISIEIPSCN